MEIAFCGLLSLSDFGGTYLESSLERVIWIRERERSNQPQEGPTMVSDALKSGISRSRVE